MPPRRMNSHRCLMWLGFLTNSPDMRGVGWQDLISQLQAGGRVIDLYANDGPLVEV